MTAAGALGLGLFLGLAGPASAHPHVFVDVKAELVFDPTGQVTAIRNIWQFDRGFTAFAVQGLDANNDGRLSLEELQPLAKVNVDSLAEYGYFTRLVTGGGRAAQLVAPTEYWLQFVDGRLALFFTLPLKTPLQGKGNLTFSIFDPEYFVAFSFVDQTPLALTDAPAACQATYKPGRPLDAATMAEIAGIPASQHDLPPELARAAKSLGSSFQVSCP